MEKSMEISFFGPKIEFIFILRGAQNGHEGLISSLKTRSRTGSFQNSVSRYTP